MKNFLKLFILFFVALSCNSFEESPIIETQSDSNEIIEKANLNPPVVKNGILNFQDEESMIFWLQEVRKMEPSQFSKWEKNLKFNSFATLFDKLVDDEIEASDSLTMAYNQSGNMPDRIHPKFPIHSKKTLIHLPYLHVFPEGGIAPLSSILENGMERLVNEQSKVVVGDQMIQYKENNKLINGKVLKSAVRGLNLLVTPTPTGYTERHISTVGNYRTITDLTFTIRQSSAYYVSGPSPIMGWGTDTFPEWHIKLRNFRHGFFGWNTRKTTSLKIEGDFSHAWITCGSNSNLYDLVYYNGSMTKTSGGSNTTSIEWTFIDPNFKFNRCYNQSISTQLIWGSNFDFEITGEGNNVSNFNGIYYYEPN